MKLNSFGAGCIAAILATSAIATVVAVVQGLDRGDVGDPTIKSTPVVEFVNKPLTAEYFQLDVVGSKDVLTMFRVVDHEKGTVCYMRSSYDARPLSCVNDFTVAEKEMTLSEEELSWMYQSKK